MPKPNKQKDEAAMSATDNDKKRFFGRVTKTESCWLFSNAPSHPYGQIFIQGWDHFAHRFSKLIHDGRPDDEAPFACHTCPNRNCVNPDHLYWGSQGDNNRDTESSVGGFRRKRGENHGNSKLSAQDVLSIYKSVEAGSTLASMAKKYGVDETNIKLIVTQKAWRHLTGELKIIPKRHSRGFFENGEKHHAAKLSNDQVSRIKKRLTDGESQRDIARVYGVSRACIGSINTGKCRAAVPWPVGATAATKR
jgi:hypothetical protein